MTSFRNLLILAGCILGGLLQWLCGNIPLQAMAFPVNFALLALLVGVVWVIHREGKQHPWVVQWASPVTSVVLIALLGICSLCIAFVPEGKVQQSWVFNVLNLLMLSQLLLTVFRYSGPFKRRFYLTHVGLFCLIVGLSLGAADQHRWKTLLHRGETTEVAFDAQGFPHTLAFPIRLDDFKVNYYANGTPEHYWAKISAFNETHNLEVNHPWSPSWKEDVYLTHYGREKETQQEYCVLELITQPWKPVIYLGLALTALGAVLLLWGKKTKNHHA